MEKRRGKMQMLMSDALITKILRILLLVRINTSRLPAYLPL